MTISRRQFILGSTAAGAAGLASYTFQRGLRIPPFHWEPNHMALKMGSLNHQTNQLLLLPATTEQKSYWRATTPEPNLVLQSSDKRETILEVQNLSAKAVLSVTGADHEERISGTQREIKLKLSAEKPTSLSWQLENQDDGISFAAIGDTGGDLELGWCMQRASGLGADFLLHLGDFNYQEGDYQRTIDYFKTAEIPTYVSIGNHDFHDSGGIYGRFISEIGPLNQVFEIANTRFLNIDTAAGFFPISSGHRGRLFSTLQQQKVVNTIAFTHCPLVDPDSNSHHDIGSEKERAWLIKQLHAVGVSSLLCGHIHINDRRTIANIDQLIVGQGLGHQDLLVGQDHSKMAIGNIDRSGKFQIELADLAMPMELHCHPRSDSVKNSLIGSEHQQLIETVERACAQRS